MYGDVPGYESQVQVLQCAPFNVRKGFVEVEGQD